MRCPFCPPYEFTPILESATSVAFADRFPVTDGHTLIIPRRHVGSLFELTGAEQLDLLQTAAGARLVLQNGVNIDGFNLAVNDGAAAGQTVMHAHLHLIPRHFGDQEDPRGGVRWLFPDKARYWKD